MPALASFLQRLTKRTPQPHPPRDDWSAAQDFTASLTPKASAAPRKTQEQPNSARLAPQAAALAARLPDLMLQANHLAATLQAGQHGQKRAGSGESFWQYRQAQPGEPVHHIDWRQSARTAHAYVRETEAQAPQTYLLWCDLTPSMQWRSAPNLPEKGERAILLQLALAAYLLRNGEHVRLLTPSGPATPPPAGTPLERLALALVGMAKTTTPPFAALPPTSVVPRHARLIIASDFLCDAPLLHATLQHLAGVPAQAHLVHIADPAEYLLPYKGHITFQGLEHEAPLDLPHVQALQQAYKDQMSAHTATLHTYASRYGHTLTHHTTQNAPLPTLLALQDQMSAHTHHNGGRV
ncbi:DUF58 domain-containing protein [Acetobacter orientalis]|uniref:DUF58 domain-containing protein n=1 Tax=Acetobacter orientalis TaxID=146474 RepID=UPI0020A46EFE|nr:DUF58 domain-containing protein [Acetobacter orientalis]MCP1221643.1 DUF58 domain-containing protein [Acetobacter orientalis]